MLVSIQHGFTELLLYSFSSLNKKSVIAISTPIDSNPTN